MHVRVHVSAAQWPALDAIVTRYVIIIGVIINDMSQ